MLAANDPSYLIQWLAMELCAAAGIVFIPGDFCELGYNY